MRMNIKNMINPIINKVANLFRSRKSKEDKIREEILKSGFHMSKEDKEEVERMNKKYEEDLEAFSREMDKKYGFDETQWICDKLGITKEEYEKTHNKTDYDTINKKADESRKRRLRSAFKWLSLSLIIRTIREILFDK